MKQIVSQFLKGLGGIAKETGEKLTEESKNLFENVISGKELLGNIKPMSDEELQKNRMEDEEEKRKEMDKLKNQMAEKGRNVEEEIKIVIDEKKKQEEEQERMLLEKVRQQREAEERERQAMMEADTVSSNPAKRKKSRGSAFAKGKNGQASQSDMSVTAEYGKKPD